jgi:hypothetical protein
MLQACETYLEGIPNDDNLYKEEDDSMLPISLKNMPKDSEASDIRISVVQIYGRCSITMPDGRLIAFAGIAKLIPPPLNDHYLAEHLEEGPPVRLGLVLVKYKRWRTAIIKTI